tara:strand:+ start:594 stop:977 length:384 start_codon:yes stop_codon:yes gene_type:complete
VIRILRNEGVNMKITVIHKAMRDETPTPVALVNIPNPSNVKDIDDVLEYAYRWTQNLGGSWSKKIGMDANDNVEVLAPLHWDEKNRRHLGLRSTMTFDEMVVHMENENAFWNGKRFKVSSFGFKEIE